MYFLFIFLSSFGALYSGQTFCVYMGCTDTDFCIYDICGLWMALVYFHGYVYGHVYGCMFMDVCLWVCVWVYIYGYVYGYRVSIPREAWFNKYRGLPLLGARFHHHWDLLLHEAHFGRFWDLLLHEARFHKFWDLLLHEAHFHYHWVLLLHEAHFGRFWNLLLYEAHFHHHWVLLLHEAHFHYHWVLLLHEVHLDGSSNFSNFSPTKMEKFAPVCSVEINFSIFLKIEKFCPSVEHCSPMRNSRFLSLFPLCRVAMISRESVFFFSKIFKILLKNFAPVYHGIRLCDISRLSLHFSIFEPS
jgi:hypothetical protein